MFYKVSVVMATYNGEEFIREQLDSILNQTYPIYEIIIHDDCSTDSTVGIIREYISKHDIIKLRVNDSNIGVNENFRRATMEATGDLICFSDQDDIWFPDKVEKQVNAIGSNAMCYSYHFQGCDMDHKILVKHKCAPERQMFNAIVGHSMMLKSSFIQNGDSWFDCGYFDQWISVYAHLKGGVSVVEEPLNLHRKHAGQASSSPKSRQFPLWYPYIIGYFKYRELQNNTEFVKFYTKLEIESRGVNNLVNDICCCLLDKSIFSFFKLSRICLDYRETVYPGNVSGISGCIKAYFYPGIFATYFIDHD